MFLGTAEGYSFYFPLCVLRCGNTACIMLLAEAVSGNHLEFWLCVLIAGCMSQASYSKPKWLRLDYVDGCGRLQKWLYFILQTFLVPYVFTTPSVKSRLMALLFHL